MHKKPINVGDLFGDSGRYRGSDPFFPSLPFPSLPSSPPALPCPGLPACLAVCLCVCVTAAHPGLQMPAMASSAPHRPKEAQHCPPQRFHRARRATWERSFQEPSQKASVFVLLSLQHHKTEGTGTLGKQRKHSLFKQSGGPLEGGFKNSKGVEHWRQGKPNETSVAHLLKPWVKAPCVLQILKSLLEPVAFQPATAWPSLANIWL